MSRTSRDVMAATDVSGSSGSFADAAPNVTGFVALRWEFEVEQDTACEAQWSFIARSVTDHYHPYAWATQDGAIVNLSVVGGSSASYVRAHAGPLDTRPVTSDMVREIRSLAGQSTGTSAFQLALAAEFKGGYPAAFSLLEAEFGDAQRGVNGDLKMKLECEAPLRWVERQGSSQARILSSFHAERGAGVDVFFGPHAGLMDVAELVTQDPVVEFFFFNGVGAGVFELETPNQTFAWQGTPADMADITIDRYYFTGGPGTWRFTMTQATLLWNPGGIMFAAHPVSSWDELVI